MVLDISSNLCDGALYNSSFTELMSITEMSPSSSVLSVASVGSRNSQSAARCLTLAR